MVCKFLCYHIICCNITYVRTYVCSDNVVYGPLISKSECTNSLLCISNNENLHPSTFNYTVILSKLELVLFSSMPQYVTPPPSSCYGRGESLVSTQRSSYPSSVGIHLNFGLILKCWPSVGGLELKTLLSTTFLTKTVRKFVPCEDELTAELVCGCLSRCVAIVASPVSHCLHHTAKLCSY